MWIQVLTLLYFHICCSFYSKIVMRWIYGEDGYVLSLDHLEIVMLCFWCLMILCWFLRMCQILVLLPDLLLLLVFLSAHLQILSVRILLLDVEQALWVQLTHQCIMKILHIVNLWRNDYFSDFLFSIFSIWIFNPLSYKKLL